MRQPSECNLSNMENNRPYLAFGTPDFTEHEIDAVARVMRTGWVGMGNETLEFEKELASYLGVKHVVSVNSCTSALFLSLLIGGVGEGDEVIVPSLTWCATANSAMYLGAKAVFCDVDIETMSVTAESILAKVTPKTRAVIIVHYGGLATDVVKLRQFLPESILIIEDAAHAMGARYSENDYVGSSGNLTCFSFYANKNLSTADGGAIALNDDNVAEKLRRLRMSGMGSNAWSRYSSPSLQKTELLTELGYKMNYTDLQAAIGRVQLGRLKEMTSHRHNLARYYKKCLDQAGIEVAFQQGVFSDKHAVHLFVVRFCQKQFRLTRDELFKYLREANVGVSIHYSPLHIQPLYSQMNESLPVTMRLSEEIMTLPMSARMTFEDIDYVVGTLDSILNRKNT